MLILKNGSKFEGEFNLDHLVKGTHTWNNGDKYDGSFENYKMHGKGIFNPIEGDKYNGEF